MLSYQYILVDTGLIVIGGANQNLFVSQFQLAIERLTQKYVERMIVVSLLIINFSKLKHFINLGVCYSIHSASY